MKDFKLLQTLNTHQYGAINMVLLRIHRRVLAITKRFQLLTDTIQILSFLKIRIKGDNGIVVLKFY